MLSRSSGRAAAGLALLAGTVLSASGAFAADVTYERLVHPEDGNWLSNNRTYDAHRYSPLNEITTENVAGLKMAFAVPLTPHMPAGLGGGMHGTALVDDGIMYMVDGAGVVYRIDVSGGHRGYINWIMDPETDAEVGGIVNNRGVALLGDKVYSVTRDGYLTATDAATGEQLWQVATQQDPDEYFTMAPLAIDGKIVLGPAGDAPMRGRLEARSAEDGSALWTFWAIPGPGEPGHETWPQDSDVWQSGASSFWVTGSYDPDLNLLYYGVSNPTPFGDPKLRPGDNLYSSSTVALDGNTGAVKWYFQYTPNEQWDYDEIGTQLLYQVNGERRLSHFGRNGFYYTLDATNGQFIKATQYVDKVNWTAGIDPKTGKPVEYDPDLAAGGIQKYAIAPYGGDNAATEICPNIQGGNNHWPTAYSDRTHLAYGAAIEGCNAGQSLGDKQSGSVLSFDADGNIVKQVRTAYAPYGGALTTAGGLVFSSTVDGEFFAMNDETLDTLWSINLGSQIEAPPVTYSVGGKQYIALPVSGSGISALLGGGGYLTRGDDPNAASVANQQRTWTLYFFAL